MKRTIIIFSILFLVLEGLIVLGAWWMIDQVDTGALATDTPAEAKRRIVQLCAAFGAGIGLLLLVTATVTARGKRSER
ncbi:hypothetical protein [Aeromicrobium sp. CTD01-1L150]|uniref:hypothetical protein n=1 Tax=Aeromicrobium sp. CTD01-1L150 TaxID=3341830 RepID=UPI0035C110B2